VATRPRPDRIPASPAQQRLLILDRLGDTGTAYNYPLVFRVRGPLDIRALKGALADVVARHEPLRTVFGEQDGEYHQRILPPDTVAPLHITECGEPELDARVAAAAAHRFQLASEIPLRVNVFRVGPNNHTVAVVLHHIATDEWSDGPLLAGLNAGYAARTTGRVPGSTAPAVQYADYTLWQRDVLDLVGADQLRYWRTALAGAPDELTLPADRPRPTRPSGTGGTLHADIPAEVAGALRALATGRQVSMLMVLHAAVAALLHRLGAGDDLVMGTPVAGRHDTALAEVVGFFVNTLVLRTDITGNPSFDELLDRVRTADLAAFAHQDLPFDHVVEDLNPPRVAGRNPLFNVFIGYHLRAGQDTAMFGLPTEWSEPAVTAAMFDLGFTLIDRGPDGGATIVAEFSADLFDQSSVRTLTQRLIAVLACTAADPTVSVAALDVLLPGEREVLLAQRNCTEHDIEAPDLAIAFGRQARSTPDAEAVRDDTTVLSYADLDDWSDRLAATLVEAGAGSGAVVAVSLPRSSPATPACRGPPAWRRSSPRSPRSRTSPRRCR